MHARNMHLFKLEFLVDKSCVEKYKLSLNARSRKNQLNEFVKQNPAVVLRTVSSGRIYSVKFPGKKTF